jgi:hypothetical protein
MRPAVSEYAVDVEGANEEKDIRQAELVRRWVHDHVRVGRSEVNDVEVGEGTAEGRKEVRTYLIIPSLLTYMLNKSR